MTLKFENIAQIGDRIRSYDFRGRIDCYVEGIVKAISSERGFRAFVITVDKDGWPEEPDTVKGQKVTRTGPGRVGETTFVPMEIAFMEYEGRILNLTADLARKRKQ